MSNKLWKNRQRVKLFFLAAILGLLLSPTALLAANEGPYCLCYFRVTSGGGFDKGNFCKQEAISGAELVGKYNENPQGFCVGTCQASVKAAANPIDKLEYFQSQTIPVFDRNNSGNADVKAYLSSMDKCLADPYSPPPSQDWLASPNAGFVLPVLETDIPGISFSQPLEKNGNLSISFISDYFSGLYKYLLGISVTIAIVMIMVGGVQYILAGEAGKTKEAKERMTNAVVGFVLLLSVFVLLYTINPQLTVLNPILVKKVQPDPYMEKGENEELVQGATVDMTGMRPPNPADNLEVPYKGSAFVSAAMATEVEEVAANLLKSSYGLAVSSGFRSRDKQVELILDRCNNPPGSATCDSKDPSKGTPCMFRQDPATKELDVKSCPHTTGAAVDLWGMKQLEVNGKMRYQTCISQSDCLKNLPACFKNECQAALIKEMTAKGFCVLQYEPWHFEKPKMSRGCLSSNPY